ncbi:RNA-directed DNA polymerase, eukaryota [Tanacetum coccineum]
MLSHCKIRVGSGLHTSFWNAIWLGDYAFSALFPRIYALETNKNCTVADKLQGPFSLSFRRPVRGGAESHQLDQLQSLIGPIILSSLDDRWRWDLNGEGIFRVQDARNLLDEFFLPKDPVATRWVKSVPIKVNVFVWKLHLDRLPTRVNLARRGVQISSMMCPLCNNAGEDSSHLFFGCDMAIDITRLVCRWWHLAWTPVGSFSEWLAWFKTIRMGSKEEENDDKVIQDSFQSIFNEYNIAENSPGHVENSSGQMENSPDHVENSHEQLENSPDSPPPKLPSTTVLPPPRADPNPPTPPPRGFARKSCFRRLVVKAGKAVAAELRADTIVKLKKALPELENEVRRPSNYVDFYSYAFRYCLTVVGTDVTGIHMVIVAVNQNDFCRTAAVTAVSIAGIFADVDKTLFASKALLFGSAVCLQTLRFVHCVLSQDFIAFCLKISLRFVSELLRLVKTAFCLGNLAFCVDCVLSLHKCAAFCPTSTVGVLACLAFCLNIAFCLYAAFLYHIFLDFHNFGKTQGL